MDDLLPPALGLVCRLASLFLAALRLAAFCFLARAVCCAAVCCDSSNSASFREALSSLTPGAWPLLCLPAVSG